MWENKKESWNRSNRRLVENLDKVLLKPSKICYQFFVGERGIVQGLRELRAELE